MHQFERGEALDNITKDVKKALEAECDEESLKVLSKTVDTVRKEVSRLILEVHSVQESSNYTNPSSTNNQ